MRQGLAGVLAALIFLRLALVVWLIHGQPDSWGVIFDWLYGEFSKRVNGFYHDDSPSLLFFFQDDSPFHSRLGCLCPALLWWQSTRILAEEDSQRAGQMRESLESQKPMRACVCTVRWTIERRSFRDSVHYDWTFDGECPGCMGSKQSKQSYI